VTDGAYLDIFNGDGQTVSQFDFVAGTNAAGDITSWYIAIQESANGYQEFFSYCGVIDQYDSTGYADQTAESQTSPTQGGGVSSGGSISGCGTAPLLMTPSPVGTPEPPSSLLLDTGLLGLLALAGRSKCHGIIASQPGFQSEKPSRD
jgi:hypothetical protein